MKRKTAISVLLFALCMLALPVTTYAKKGGNGGGKPGGGGGGGEPPSGSYDAVLAYSTRNNKGEALYLANADGSNAVKIASIVSSGGTGFVAGSDSLIAVDDLNGDIWRYDFTASSSGITINQSTSRLIDRSPWSIGSMDVSVDGSRIVWTEGLSGGGDDLKVMDLSSGTITTVLVGGTGEGPLGYCIFLRDGSIVIERRRQGPEGNWDGPQYLERYFPGAGNTFINPVTILEAETAPYFFSGFGRMDGSPINDTLLVVTDGGVTEYNYTANAASLVMGGDFWVPQPYYLPSGTEALYVDGSLNKLDLTTQSTSTLVSVRTKVRIWGPSAR